MTADAPVVDEPGTGSSSRRHLVWYLVIGGLSYVVDTGLLLLLTGPLDKPLWLGTTIGFWTSVVVNFSLNRIVFARERTGTSIATHTVRYGVLLGANWLVTLAIVSFGVSQGLSPLWPKTFAVLLTTCWNFVLYRRWVFK